MVTKLKALPMVTKLRALPMVTKLRGKLIFGPLALQKPANLMISGNLHADVEQLFLDSGVIKVGVYALGAWGYFTTGTDL